MFALRDPPDPELTTSSMIICKSAAKQCIGIIESAKDVLVTPLCTHVLIVSAGLHQIYRCLTHLLSNPETHVHVRYIPSPSFLEEGEYRLCLSGVPRYHGCHGNGAPDVEKVTHLFLHERILHRLRGNPFRRWRTSSCLRYVRGTA